MDDIYPNYQKMQDEIATPAPQPDKEDEAGTTSTPPTTGPKKDKEG